MCRTDLKELYAEVAGQERQPDFEDHPRDMYAEDIRDYFHRLEEAFEAVEDNEPVPEFFFSESSSSFHNDLDESEENRRGEPLFNRNRINLNEFLQSEEYEDSEVIANVENEIEIQNNRARSNIINQINSQRVIHT